MYGKIFDSIYEGTLYGQWEALVTFQQMIVLCDADGMIDMTPQAIAARTSIPLKIIRKGLAILEAPDPYSRTPDQDGKRLELIDAHKPWGWHIVNHEKYMRMQDADTVREQTRERVRRHREARASVTVTVGNDEKRSVTVGNGSKRHTDIDTNIEKPMPPAGAVFGRFWSAWPSSSRKASRSKCEAVWARGKFDSQVEQIVAHVEAMKASPDWRKESGAFIPAPLVYLNQRRWEGAEISAPQKIKVDV